MRNLTTLLLLLLTPATLPAAPSAIDFAYQAQLEHAEQPLQRVALPIEIVLDLTRADLGDLAVFNANGKALVHSITRKQDSSHEVSRQLRYYEFSHYLQQRNKTVTQRDQTIQDGSLTEVETTQTLPVQAQRKDYLVELSSDEYETAFDLIELDWSHEPVDQILRVKVEAGNELDDMRIIQHRKSLTNRASEDRSWRSISGIPKGYRYMRIGPVGTVTAFELHGATGIEKRTQAAPPLTHRLTPQLTNDEDIDTYSFSFPSAVQVKAIRLLPGETNTVLNGDIYGLRQGAKEPSLIKRGFRQHNIEATNVKPSPPLSLPRGEFSEIQFRTRSRLNTTPEVELIYTPHELVFLGDGNSPYTLAWGNHESEAASASLSEILELDLQQAQNKARLVKLGPIEESGGIERLTSSPVLPWKKWLLWSLLILAALVTARMALNLYRELNRATGANIN